MFLLFCVPLSHSKSWYWWRLVYVFFSLPQIHLRRSCSPLWLCIFPLKTNVNVHVVGRQRTTCSQYILKEKIYCALFFKTLNKKIKFLTKINNKLNKHVCCLLVLECVGYFIVFIKKKKHNKVFSQRLWKNICARSNLSGVWKIKYLFFPYFNISNLYIKIVINYFLYKNNYVIKN